MKDIFDIIKQRIKLSTYALKTMKLKLIGNRYVGLCPFHHEKTPSFSINNEQDLFYCFGCHKGGDLFNFYCYINNCEKKDALKELSILAGVRYNDSIKNELNILLKHFLSFSNHIHWLENRGVSLESIKKFQLGWSGSVAELGNFIRNNHLSLNHLGFQENLLKSLTNRIMFPIFNEIGSLVSFSGRTIDDKSGFKYINGSESEIFHKNEILYGLNFIKNKSEIYLVEGYLDVIMMDQFGHSSVAIMGTAINENHLKKLWTYTNKIIIALDGDEAGINAAEKTAFLAFKVITSGKQLSFIQFPNSHDPASYLNVFKSLDNLKQYPLYEYIILNKEMPSDPDKKALFFSNLNDLANTISDKDLRFEYRQYWNSLKFKSKKTKYTKINKLTENYLILLLFKYVLCYNGVLDHVAEDFLKIKMNDLYNINLTKILNNLSCDDIFLQELDHIFIEKDLNISEVLSLWYDVYAKLQKNNLNQFLFEDFSEENWQLYKQQLEEKEKNNE